MYFFRGKDFISYLTETSLLLYFKLVPSKLNMHIELLYGSPAASVFFCLPCTSSIKGYVKNITLLLVLSCARLARLVAWS